jgi:hypothetical protein
MRSGPVLLLATLLAGISSLHAQPAPQPQQGPDGNPRTRVPGVDVLPLPGLPFIGKDTITWIRPTDGGGSTTVYLEANIVRDSQGRLYRESHRFGPAGTNPRSTLKESTVSDPVAHTRTVCNYATHRCIITNYVAQRPSLTGTPAVTRAGSSDGGQRFLTRESLGEQVMENLPVTGTRETTTIAPGVMGNDQALTMSREIWYSPDLKTNLAVTRVDPREGTQVIRLAILSRSDPDPSVFAPPPTFTVQDARHGQPAGN